VGRQLPFTLVLIALSLLSCGHDPAPKRTERVFTTVDQRERAEHLKASIRVDSRNVKKRMELGRLFLAEDMIPEAAEEFGRILEVEPESVQASLLLSLSLQKANNPDLPRAASTLEKALGVEPTNADVRLHLAQIYGKLGDESRAISEFRNAIQFSTAPATRLSAHLGLMGIFQKRNDFAAAEKEHEAAREIFPDVDSLLRQAELGRMTPPPKYGGGGMGESGIHPALEDRIKRLQDAMTSGGRKND